MNVNIVFDDPGKVIAITYPSRGNTSGSTARYRLIPCRPGHHAATVEAPAALRHLKPRALHDAVHVEHKDGSPHLIATTK